MKISILMPTYNDADSIVETLNSLMCQTYTDWQLIIMDDGSTDDVSNVVKEYINQNKCGNKIEYYYQQNKDQLNAIINSIQYIKGEYVYILHSDDLLPDGDTLKKLVDAADKDKYTDVFIGDLIVIDGASNVTGVQKVANFMKATKGLPTLLLWLGRNLYADTIFAKKDVFINNIYESYLTWNMPFWIHLEKNARVLNVKNLDFPILKYRVHGNNYINNEIGKLNVINGEIRTVSRLMKFYNIPFYKLQFYIYRIFNKLKISDLFYPIYFNKETKNKSEIIEFVIRKRFGLEYKKNMFLNSLVNFYKNFNTNKLILEKIDEEEIIYKGKDIRMFNKAVLDDSISPLYKKIMLNMNNGFNEIIVENKEDRDKVIDIVKFLCIYPYVKISIK